MIYALLDRGEDVVVLDNLSTGNRSLASDKVALVEGEVADQALVKRLITDNAVDAAIHVAGL
jgi:UDP-glucose 4-epimerase